MSKIIGLTGGIGSGKTMVAKYMQSQGIPVYFADDEAKKIMSTQEVIEAIKNEFGEEFIDSNAINREKLAQLVFNEKQKLERLNDIIHPKVKKHFEAWLHANKAVPFVVKEAAILFESGNNASCDLIITVIAPLETRIERVMARDKLDRSAVIKRIENQWTDEQRIAKSDFVIQNISIEDTYKQIDKILLFLKNH
jgi:dephospho-CoA kinase